MSRQPCQAGLGFVIVVREGLPLPLPSVPPCLAARSLSLALGVAFWVSSVGVLVPLCL